MSYVELQTALERMRTVQQANVEVLAARLPDWRHDVIRQRRVLAELIGRLTELTPAPSDAVSAPTIAAFQRAVSGLRAALAEHQATWPAVSLDPDATEYAHSIKRVHDRFLAVQAAVNAFDHRSSMP